VAAASGAVVVTHEGTPRAVPTASDVALAGDDEVSTTPDAHARVVLASGATVEVAAGSRVRVQKSAPKNERVALAAGEVDVHVPKLAAGESFGIATPDALVTVHGTSFVVTVRDGGSHVKVREGLVSVLAAGVETFVHPGEEWPTAPSDSPPTTTAPAPTLSSSSKAPPPVAPRSSAGHVDASTLAEQNRLLQSALDARRKGEEARAVEQLSMLLARYPRSPLAQEARVEKFRALEKMGRHEKAVAEAKRYLVEFPAGFAAEEAKSLVSR
jgi:ferric-dicitrate binding protein FerR (iron transport regulator)